MKNRTALGFLTLVCIVCLVGPVQADDKTLTIELGSGQQRYTTATLLARPEVSAITVPNDVSYRRAMNYQAVPLLSILNAPSDEPFETLEARATDGFVSQIPLSLVRKGISGGSQAWIAIEDPAMPWPNLPGKDFSAGPFYMVWEHPDRSNIGSEQWPYALAAISGVAAPTQRWPQMAVGIDVPADGPARRGQEVYIVQCLPCHRMKGAGAGNKGPDLGTPMSPTTYMTPIGLRMLIRNPKSVRTWPELQMPGFDKAMISDPDLDALIAYLAYMAEAKARSPN